jgi:hypothetical protein
MKAMRDTVCGTCSNFGFGETYKQASEVVEVKRIAIDKRLRHEYEAPWITSSPLAHSGLRYIQ